MSSQESAMNIRRIQEQRYKLALYYQRLKKPKVTNNNIQTQIVPRIKKKYELKHDDKVVLQTQKNFLETLQGLTVR